MLTFTGVEPVARQFVRERVESAEEGFRDADLPHPALDASPAGHDLGTADFGPLARRGTIDDPFLVRRAAARWIDSLAIDSFMHGDGITGLGELSCPLDGGAVGAVFVPGLVSLPLLAT